MDGGVSKRERSSQSNSEEKKRQNKQVDALADLFGFAKLSDDARTRTGKVVPVAVAAPSRPRASAQRMAVDRPKKVRAKRTNDVKMAVAPKPKPVTVRSMSTSSDNQGLPARPSAAPAAVKAVTKTQANAIADLLSRMSANDVAKTRSGVAPKK